MTDGWISRLILPFCPIRGPRMIKVRIHSQEYLFKWFQYHTNEPLNRSNDPSLTIIFFFFGRVFSVLLENKFPFMDFFVVKTVLITYHSYHHDERDLSNIHSTIVLPSFLSSLLLLFLPLFLSSFLLSHEGRGPSKFGFN